MKKQKTRQKKHKRKTRSQVKSTPRSTRTAGTQTSPFHPNGNPRSDEISRVLSDLSRRCANAQSDCDRALALAEALGGIVTLASRDRDEALALQDACARRLLKGRDRALRCLASTEGPHAPQSPVLTWHAPGESRKAG